MNFEVKIIRKNSLIKVLKNLDYMKKVDKKLTINTLIPKFNYRNKKGQSATPKKKVLL
jgi:hypothetical protein